ncbi:biotin--[acetyl-CoA-carboxylase] ligase [Cyanobacterium sp. IPPAS B-1200]|uniref:biotin--[acetyl-CoA-carboxylase] ligase n=1 Tax=Cyanobacterium sp. IPPAS B-1200 TaxID=1562720 RepID=UPI0008525116|nr:biotin--[acetyl-CoA-carboxylase] ligase [Cyanobacterium sp. IPPAS B-1200]OEJ78514.1 hypothetical protein A5482_12730 [Cyanobacterium sp. IPPAS B-1200]
MEEIIIKLSCNTNSRYFNEIRCYIYDIVTSTNIKAWELCKKNIEKPFVVLATQQTAGKGQRGNSWQSSLGGLYLTVVLSPEMVFTNINHLTLFCGVGIAEELNKYNVPIQIKWLNDLILDNKKVGGILSEVSSQNGIINNAIIGVGINWKNQIYLDNSVSIDSYIKKTKNYLIDSYNDLLNIIIKGIFTGYNDYIERGGHIFIDKYNQYLVYQGKPVIYQGMEGLVLGIDENGNLIVKFSSKGASSRVIFSPVEYGITPYNESEISKIFERFT